MAAPQPSRMTAPTLLLLMLALVTAITSIAPLDIALSRLFYTPRGFTWDPHGLMEFVRAAVPTIILGSLLFCVLLWAGSAPSRDWIWGLSTRPVVFLLASAAIGPGILVETVLKPYWGRARPKDLVEFAGHSPYTPPFVMADACTRNCSFVSGHAAIAFWLTAYALLLPQRWRAGGLWSAAAAGMIVGAVRVAQGAHFASDVAAAGLMVVTVNVALARLILPRP